jgi:hypothetical protein
MGRFLVIIREITKGDKEKAVGKVPDTSMVMYRVIPSWPADSDLFFGF